MMRILAAVAITLAAATAGAQTVRGVDLSYRDTTCAACQDFYRYANGGWTSTAVIPAEYPSAGAWVDLFERQLADMHAILDAAPADSKVGRFYATCMDSARAQADGARPLEPELARIDALTSRTDVRSEVARLNHAGVGALFTFVAAQDAKHSKEVIGDASQGGLGLPDRDYYLRADSVAVRTRAAYVAHVARMLALSGLPPAQTTGQANRIMNLEVALAKASMTIVERQDPQAIYHRMTLAALARLTPSWSWPSYFREMGHPDIRVVNVDQPAFFSAVNHLLDTTALDDWKAYLRWQYVATVGPFLDTAFVNEGFRFNALLSGAQALAPRWKRCAANTDALLGEAVGKLYVERVFPPAAKARALAMVRNLESALHDDLATLPWMSPATRTAAIVKLDAFANKIGYPDTWRDYSALVIEPGPFWHNLTAAVAFETDRQLAKIGKPFDRTEWNLTAATVNAEYNPTRNDIAFPAAILQPPMFDPSADDAANYGAIGSVIGHEMTHGFDDLGRQFDGDGNLRDWWTREDAVKYNARAARLVAQYDQYVMIDTLHVSGKQTLGENIADLGGLKIAYAALQHALRENPAARQSIDGVTPEQRFFLAFAQVWRERVRPERVRQLLQIDVHSPGRIRVDGTVANMPEFAAAFHCRLGDAMARPDSLRGQIW